MNLLSSETINGYITELNATIRLSGERVDEYLIRLFPEYSEFAELLDKELSKLIVAEVGDTDSNVADAVSTYLSNTSVFELYVKMLTTVPSEYKEMCILFGYERISVMMAMVKMLMIPTTNQQEISDELLTEMLKNQKPIAEA